MRETVSQLHAHGELWFPLLNVVATFIDGLARGKSGESKKAYIEYLEKHFPELCKDLGAEVFYKSFRCAAVHEFGVRPPYALWRDADMNGKYIETVKYGNEEWTTLNIDRLVRDFLNHVALLEKQA